MKKLDAEPGTPLRIQIKARDLFPIHDNRISEAELPLLNQIAEQLQGMGAEEQTQTGTVFCPIFSSGFVV